jgi:vacuolar protein sorting-associated protein 35
MADDDEKERLREAKKVTKQQAFYMKRALDAHKTEDAMKAAATMLGELRTSLLGPRNYYDLYIEVTQELRHLEEFFQAEQANGRKMLELYELVQCAGNVLPRLYLLLTVGSVYIASKEAPSKDILKDMVEMCRGVQHPMRGLFLRNYLSQTSKDKLPDAGSEYEGAGGSTAEAVAFVISNFTEMNKLWVRMQHQGPVREREKRERERLELRILVGTNLLRLSGLEGVTLQVYEETVLPQVLEQVVNCKDAIAQQYLMECIVQVFPVEYHQATLKVYLEHIGWLSAGANARALLTGMMDRVRSAPPPAGETAEASIFVTFAEACQSLVQKADDGMELAHALDLFKALLALALAMYPETLAYAEQVLAIAVELVSKAAPVTDPKCVATLVELTSAPLEHYPSTLSVLELSKWPPLLALLHHEKQKEVASALVAKVLEQAPAIDDAAKADKLLSFVRPLVAADPDHPDDEEDARPKPVDDDGLAEVLPLCRLLHSFAHADTDTLCRVLNTAHRHASAATRARLVYPMCSVIFGCLRAVRRIKTRADAGESVEVGVHKLLAFVATMVQAVAPLAPTLALRLYLQCALAADAAGEEGDAYEFVAQAFIVYEEEVSDSRQQVAAIVSCIATLSHMGRLGEEQYETLATKATQYSNKLLKKPDQCRAVCKCAHLFWPPANPSYREGERVLQCLQRTLKLADGCKATAAGTTLFVEALNAYLYHFGVANDHVTAEHLTSLVALVQQHLSADEGDAAAATRAFFTNTRLHLDEKKKADDDAAARFKEIEWA